MYVMISKHGSPVRVIVVGEYKDKMLTVAVARCSKADANNFVKKTGLDLAKQRLSRGHYYDRMRLDTCTAKDFKRLAVEVLEEVKQDNAKIYHKDVFAYLQRRREQQILGKISKLRNQLAEVRNGGKKISNRVILLPPAGVNKVESDESIHAKQEA